MSTPGLQDRDRHPDISSGASNAIKRRKRQTVSESDSSESLDLEADDATPSTTRPAKKVKKQITSLPLREVRKGRVLRPNLEISTLQEELRTMEDKLRMKEDELKIKGDELKAKEDELKAKNDALSRMDHEHDLLQKTQNQLAQSRERIQKLSDENMEIQEASNRALMTRGEELAAANDTIRSLTAELAKVNENYQQQLERANDSLTNMEKRYQQDLKAKEQHITAVNNQIAGLRDNMSLQNDSKDRELEQARHMLSEHQRNSESKDFDLKFLARQLCHILTKINLSGAQWLQILQKKTFLLHLAATNDTIDGSRLNFCTGWLSNRELEQRKLGNETPFIGGNDTLLLNLYGVSHSINLSTSNLCIWLLYGLKE
ncbi:hypothetical protein QBC40DRAFT_318607 [Triangularia verruculosa]|uniref:Uncharacterized protein n=1 Tax=Triangularia verruculosa TaxID=2587418 RepID=A0AAN6XMR5_9PEZI|nr:hypothetical protein QBC40DRAFT_318607 [Triangularia verruculosa]